MSDQIWEVVGILLGIYLTYLLARGIHAAARDQAKKKKRKSDLIFTAIGWGFGALIGSVALAGLISNGDPNSALAAFLFTVVMGVTLHALFAKPKRSNTYD